MRVDTAIELGVVTIACAFCIGMAFSATVLAKNNMDSTALDDKNSSKVHGSLIPKEDEEFMEESVMEMLIASIVSAQNDKVHEKHVLYYIDGKRVDKDVIKSNDKLASILQRIESKINELCEGLNVLNIQCEAVVKLNKCYVEVHITTK